MQGYGDRVRRMGSRCALWLGFLLLCPAPLRAGPEHEGWERLDAVPGWVTATPKREGWLRAVDAHVVEWLEEAYRPHMVFHEWLGIHARIENALRPALGDAAEKPALAGARAATVVRKGYVEPSEELGIPYTAFLLWETPLARVLAAVPSEHRHAARRALLEPARRPTWRCVRTEPTWVTALPDDKARFFVAVPATSVRPDVARAVGELRYKDYVRYEIANRLRVFVGKECAHATVARVLPMGRIVEAAWRKEPATAWLLWSVLIEPLLAAVPVSSRSAALEALGAELPLEPDEWEWVETEPSWAKRPHAWPECIPFVQVAKAEDPFDAQEEADAAADEAVRSFLKAKLRGVERSAAEAAIREGISWRFPCIRALREREVEPTRANPDGGAEVTTWILWQLPVDRIVDAVDEKSKGAVRRALLR